MAYKHTTPTKLTKFVNMLYVKVKAKLPTKVSELENDSGYLTQHQDLSGYVPTSRKVAGHALTSDVTVSKSDVGLGSVDNTADADKSVKYATSAGSATDQTARDNATAAKTAADSKCAKSSTSVTLATSAWSNNTATVAVNGVTADNDIVVAPAPDSFEAYGTAAIRATAQAANSVTFTCTTTPTASITINILILT